MKPKLVCCFAAIIFVVLGNAAASSKDVDMWVCQTYNPIHLWHSWLEFPKAITCDPGGGNPWSALGFEQKTDGVNYQTFQSSGCSKNGWLRNDALSRYGGAGLSCSSFKRLNIHPEVVCQLLYEVLDTGWRCANYGLTEGVRELAEKTSDPFTGYCSTWNQISPLESANVCWSFCCSYYNRWYRWRHGPGTPILLGNVSTITNITDSSSTDEGSFPDNSWSCSANEYQDNDFCDCNCGAWDPDCDNITLPTRGCSASEVCLPPGGCASRNQVVTERKLMMPLSKNIWDSSYVPNFSFYDPLLLTRSVPSAWICPQAYYDSADGCDCRCGTWDPDCDIDSSQPALNCVNPTLNNSCDLDSDACSGDSTGGGNSGTKCFSGSMVIYRVGQNNKLEITKIADLKLGDLVLDGDKNQVQFLGYLHDLKDRSDTVLAFYQNETDNQPFLEVTPEHLLFTAEDGLVFATDIKSSIHHLVNAETGIPISIAKIIPITVNGLYAPLTSSGTIMVGPLNVKASCYAHINAPVLSNWYFYFRRFYADSNLFSIQALSTLEDLLMKFVKYIGLAR